jgi:hypothetical protein
MGRKKTGGTKAHIFTMDLKAHIVFYTKSKKLWARVRNLQREKLQIRGRKQQKRSKFCLGESARPLGRRLHGQFINALQDAAGVPNPAPL